MELKPFLLLIVTLILVTSVYGFTEDIIFSDDFDRADNDGVGNNWTEFENAPNRVSILGNSLALAHDGGDQNANHTFPETAITNWNFTHRSNLYETETYYIARLYRSDTIIIEFVFGNGGMKVNEGGTLKVVQPIITNTRYDIELKNINFDTDTFDIWVDGVELNTSIGFKTVASEVNKIQFAVDSDVRGGRTWINETYLKIVTPDTENPTVTLNTVDGENFTVNETFALVYTPSDNEVLNNCSLYTNVSNTWQVNATDNTPINNTPQNLTMEVTNTFSSIIWNINCFDVTGNSGWGASNRTFSVGVIPLPPSLYDSGLISQTNWFNTDEFDTGTIAGMLMYFFILIAIIAIVVMTEKTKIPAFAVLAGLCMFFYGMLIYSTISAIIGTITCIIGTLYGLRSVTLMGQ